MPSAVPGQAPRPAPGAGPLGRVRHACAWLWWYARELNGEHAYDRYVAYARAEDPDAVLLSRSAFERRRIARRDADPREGGHCC